MCAHSALEAFLDTVGLDLLGVALTESRAGSDVVDVLLDVCWDVVSLGGDIVGPGGVLPDVELGSEQFLNFLGGGVELNPLKRNC